MKKQKQLKNLNAIEEELHARPEVSLAMVRAQSVSSVGSLGIVLNHNDKIKFMACHLKACSCFVPA